MSFKNQYKKKFNKTFNNFNPIFNSQEYLELKLDLERKIDYELSALAWHLINSQCGDVLTCAVTIKLNENSDCTNWKSGLNEIIFPLVISVKFPTGCCQCCPNGYYGIAPDIVPAVNPETLGQNTMLYFSPTLQRWDSNKLTEETEETSMLGEPPMGGYTIGKFGEQLVSIGGNIMSIGENKNRYKKWTWHSKDETLGHDTREKLFKRIKIIASEGFNASVTSDIQSMSNNRYDYTTGSGMCVIIDGKEVPVIRTDETDIEVGDLSFENNLGLGDEYQIEGFSDIGTPNPLGTFSIITDEDVAVNEKKMLTYEFKIQQGYHKGKAISIRFQNQDEQSIVESFSIIYRAKAVK